MKPRLQGHTVAHKLYWLTQHLMIRTVRSPKWEKRRAKRDRCTALSQILPPPLQPHPAAMLGRGQREEDLQEEEDPVDPGGFLQEKNTRVGLPESVRFNQKRKAPPGKGSDMRKERVGFATIITERQCETASAQGSHLGHHSKCTSSSGSEAMLFLVTLPLGKSLNSHLEGMLSSK